MSEIIKMTDGELTEVRVLQEKFQQRIFQLGQISLQKFQAKETLKSVELLESKNMEDFQNLQKEENKLIETLLAKYGEGSLDLQAGTFISEKKT